jgi:hypothetical protein
MPVVTRSSEIGLRKGRLICNMSLDDQLKFIAEGLPRLLESARSLVDASQVLTDNPREAAILASHADEECAKLLILIDIVRCPRARVASRIGPMTRWFYDHLARLIYAKAQSWRPVTAKQLQDYIDSERGSHYLEGEYGESIMPNWTLFERETALYVDIACDEDKVLQWISPIQSSPELPAMIPISFEVADALSAFGVLTLSGLEILHEVWATQPIELNTRWEITRDNYLPLAKRLEAAGLITDRATDRHATALAHTWQMPMYEMDFSPIDVALEDLLAERDAQLEQNFGEQQGWG